MDKKNIGGQIILGLVMLLLLYLLFTDTLFQLILIFGTGVSTILNLWNEDQYR